MRIAICDDDLIFQKKLREQIRELYRDIDIAVDCFSSGEELLARCEKSTRGYDVVLLDIEMKGLDGLETADALRKKNEKTAVIFVTSHEELALKGYEVSAFRFLVKPVSREKLVEAIAAAKQDLESRKTLLIQNQEGQFLIPVAELVYIEARNQQVALFTEKGMLLQRYNINDYEKELSPYGFFRVHRSFLANMSRIRGVLRGELLMDSGAKLPVSRLREKAFAAEFRSFLKRIAR